jgi:hypothetical protein
MKNQFLCFRHCKRTHKIYFCARVFTEKYIPSFSVDGKVLKLQYNDFDYCVTVENGTPEITKNGYRITANNDSFTVRL